MIRHTPLRPQSGAVLIVALLFLVVLTMLGVTAMTGTTFEERMAGNARDATVARHAAEAALRTARNLVLGLAQPTGSTILMTQTAEEGGQMMLGVFMQPVDDPEKGACKEGFCTSRNYEKGVVGVVPPEVPAGVDWSERAAPGTTTETYAAEDGANRLVGVSKQPRYIVELFCIPLVGASLDGPGGDCRMYRFTSTGWGRNPNTQVQVQEFYIAEPIVKK